MSLTLGKLQNFEDLVRIKTQSAVERQLGLLVEAVKIHF